MFEVVICIISLRNYFCVKVFKINYFNLVPAPIFGVPAPIFLQKALLINNNRPAYTVSVDF